GTEYEAAWSTDEKSGLEKAFCCLYATSRDYARLGRLWLNNGVWDSTEVIPSKQLQYMLEPLNVDYGPCPEACYAISFWIETYRGINFYYARGILGQYIIVIPDKNMLIVRTGKTRMEKTERFHPKDLYIYIDQALALAE
ncbi:MAG: serine hydrolase, partial [Luteibaculum sp.]